MNVIIIFDICHQSQRLWRELPNQLKVASLELLEILVKTPL